MVGMAISPESPIWLEWKGKWEACNISHLILVGTPAPMDEQDPALQSDEDDLLIDDGDRDFEVTLLCLPWVSSSFFSVFVLRSTIMWFTLKHVVCLPVLAWQWQCEEMLLV